MLFTYLAVHPRAPGAPRRADRGALALARPRRRRRLAERAALAAACSARRGRADGRAEVQLRLPADAWIDLEAAEEAIHRAEAAVAQGDWARGWGPSLIALFTARRGFLPGEDLPWADEHRRRLEEIRLLALECYAAVALGVGGSELAPGERVARELIAAAPFRERGHALLMEILARAATAPRPCASTRRCAGACATSSAHSRRRSSARSRTGCCSADGARLGACRASPRSWPL